MPSLEEENVALRARIAELEAKLPKPLEDPNAALKAQVQAWGKQYPGHCWMCGLPREHCIHMTFTYKQVKDSLHHMSLDLRMQRLLEVSKSLYREALTLIPDVTKLPPSPKPWQRKIREEFKPMPSIWDRLDSE